MDDGSLVISPAGGMQTTWKLRPNVTWQDGRPLTADDLVFTFAFHTRPEFVSSITAVSPFIERMEKLDPLTVLVTWKTTYYNALYLDHRAFWLMPEHILGESIDAEREAALGQPYFTTEYVHLGPFRLVDWGLGQDMVFERFDGYFLGRPKVGKIIIRAISDRSWPVPAGGRARMGA